MTLPSRPHIALFVVSVLLFVWSVPGVIGLRHGLLLAAVLLTASLTSTAVLRRCLAPARLPLATVAVLSVWLVVQAVLLSPEPSWALGELRGQWLTACLALLVGLFLGSSTDGDPQPIITSLASVLLLQASIAVGHSVLHYFQHGSLLQGEVPLTRGKLEMSFILNILMAMLVVDALQRASGRAPLLNWGAPMTATAFAIGLTAAYLAAARNGMIGALFLAASGIGLFLYQQRRRLGLLRAAAVAAALLLAVLAYGYVSLRSDERWASFRETVPLALDIDGNKAWMSIARYPLPKLASGETVDASAYLRIAFMRAGMRQLCEHPWGVGYGRNALRHALAQTDEVQLGHAHSGFIDLGIGGGFPALALWLAFVGSAFAMAWRTYFRDGRPSSLLLVLLLAENTGRMVLDSVNRDHMLQIFLFLAALLLAWAGTGSGAARAVKLSPSSPPPRDR